MTRLILLTLLATAARADLFEQLPILHGIDEKLVAADIAADGRFIFVNSALTFELFETPTEIIIDDTVTVWSYVPAIFMGRPYAAGFSQVEPELPMLFERTFRSASGDFSAAVMPPIEVVDEFLNPITVGVTSASGFLYGGVATVPEPATVWLLALGCAGVSLIRKRIWK